MYSDRYTQVQEFHCFFMNMFVLLCTKLEYFYWVVGACRCMVCMGINLRTYVACLEHRCTHALSTTIGTCRYADTNAHTRTHIRSCMYIYSLLGSLQLHTHNYISPCGTSPLAFTFHVAHCCSCIKKRMYNTNGLNCYLRTRMYL